MKQVKGVAWPVFIFGIACFGMSFLMNGCKYDTTNLKGNENPDFKRRVKIIEKLPSDTSDVPNDIVYFLEIDGHRYIFYNHLPGWQNSTSGMVHDPECKCHGEKK